MNDLTTATENVGFCLLVPTHGLLLVPKPTLQKFLFFWGE